MKEYPRIQSLGAINIIHHQEFDYEFHPFRTDFTGESGVGKSIITDLIQLILIGSTYYQSSTKGSGDRPYNTLIIETPDKGDYGYAYLNVEVAKEKFLLVGSYIERRSKKTQSFIVQRNLDFEQENFLPFDKPLKVEDFEKDNKWMTLQEFDRHTNTSNNLGCKIYNVFKDFHEALHKNKILPIDVFTNKSDLVDYAKILQAFARRDINVKSDVNLQEFLHGKTAGAMFYDEFQEAVKKMEDSIVEHRKNHQEVLDIKKKNKLLKELRKLKVTKDNTFVKYNNLKYHFEYHKLKQINDDIKKLIHNYYAAVATIKALCTLKSKTLQECDTKLIKLILEEEELKEEKDTLQTTVNFFRLVDSVFEKGFYNKVEELKVFYKRYKENEVQINRYAQLKKQLQQQNLEDDFNALDCNKTFKEIVDFLDEKIVENEDAVTKYKELISFNDYENPKSMAYWVINQKRDFNPQEESTLRYFFDIETVKPEKIRKDIKYLPNPDELLKVLKKESYNLEENGFWIELSGLHIFIENIETPIFKTSNIEELKNIFESNNKDLSIKLKEKEASLRTHKKLREFILEKLTEPETDLKIWSNRNKLQKYTEAEKEIFLSFEKFDFDKEVEKYTQKGQIVTTYKKAKEKYDNIILELGKTRTLQEELNKFEIVETPQNDSKILKEAEIQNIEENQSPIVLVKKVSSIQDFINPHNIIVENLNVEENLDELVKNRDTRTIELETLKLKYSYVLHIDLEKRQSEEEYRTAKENFNTANDAYWTELKAILISYNLSDKEAQTKGEHSFIQLAKLLFPSEVFKNVLFEDDQILNGIEKYLEKIININATLNKNKLLAIKDILDKLKTEVRNQLETNKAIKRFFKEDYAKITGDSNASLVIKQSSTVSLNWIAEYLKKLAKVDIGLFDYQDSLNAKNKELPSLKDKLLFAYQEFSKTPEPNITVRRLLSPFSYYDLEYSIETKSGKRNSGSTGQTYTSIALLCIAKLSLKNNNYNTTKQIPGLRFMAIDEAEGIGSNFDMLSKIAKRFDYQIISLSINPNKLKKENQYIYRLTKIEEEERANHHPSVIFS
ncbi:hypothetical protein [Kordia sp.]|uniref:hypothetical protein n=1 Tax=Kordia sp. TaxID=1965332 RepID=UPI003D29F504